MIARALFKINYHVKSVHIYGEYKSRKQRANKNLSQMDGNDVIYLKGTIGENCTKEKKQGKTLIGH